MQQGGASNRNLSYACNLKVELQHQKTYHHRASKNACMSADVAPPLVGFSNHFILQNHHDASLVSLEPHLIYHDKCHLHSNNYHRINSCHVNKSDPYHNKKGYIGGFID